MPWLALALTRSVLALLCVAVVPALCRATALAGLLILAAPVAAAPATKLVVYIPCVAICPGPVFYHLVISGEAFPLAVEAVDASGRLDPTYRGTVVFSSTDPLGTLPPPYSFTAADQGYVLLLSAGVLRTAGSQTIFVRDVQNGLSGSWEVTVEPALGAIPAQTPSSAVALVLGLAAVGFWLLRSRA